MALRRAFAVLNHVGGYAFSVVLLAIASLIVIPVMVRVAGGAGWGAVALGQSVGAISAVLIGYGWGFSGPAVIARSGAPQRRKEFVDSVRVKGFLAVPAVIAAVGVAWIIAPAHAPLAALGAIGTGVVGLSANWYFVGIGRPYLLLALETLPRVLGTTGAIALILVTGEVAWGLVSIAVGMVLAAVLSAWWILRSTRSAERLLPSALRVALRNHGSGLLTSLSSAAYVAAPLAIVSSIAVPVLPVYALVDKVQRQISVALGPLVTAVQGWVPRGGADTGRRARRVAVVGASVALAIGIGVWVSAPLLLHWLGGGRIAVGGLLTVLMAVFVALNFFESLIAKAVLASIDRLRLAARATIVSSVVALPLVAVGAYWIGAEGALAAVVLGLAVRTIIEVIPALRAARRPEHRGNEDDGEQSS